MTILKLIELDGGRKTTEAALRLMEQDPHGFTLAAVGITVVFSCLVILFCVYSLSGAIFSGKLKAWATGLFKRKSSAKGEVAAAIAVAIQADKSGETEAAIATALHLYLSECCHDSESGIITIKANPRSEWNNKSHGFRKTV